jgi:hypothetical protein
MSLFEEAVARYQPLRIFLQEYLSPYDLCLLRLSCQTFRSLFVRSHKKINKVFITNWALICGDFHIAVWCLERKFRIKKLVACKEFFQISQTLEIEEAQKWIIKNYFRSPNTNCSGFCAESNNFSLLKWVTDQKYGLDSLTIACWAAFHGNFEMLDWIVEMRTDVRDPSFAVNVRIVRMASKGGQLEMIKKLIDFGFKPDVYCFNAAVESNQLSVALWLQEKYAFRLDKNATTATAASTSGSLEIIKFIIEQGCLYNGFGYKTKSVGAIIIKNRDIKLLKWAHKKGLQFKYDECETAASMGDLDTLKWLRKKKCDFGETLRVAAVRGQFELFQWALENGADHHPTEYNYYSAVAKFGNIPFLQYLCDKNWPESHKGKKAISVAALNGDFATVKWLIGHIPPCSPPTSVTMFNAVVSHSLPILQTLIQRRDPWDPFECHKEAIERGYQDIVDFLENEEKNPTWAIEEILEYDLSVPKSKNWDKYLVKWVGKASSENSWLSKEELLSYNVGEMLREFDNPERKKRKKK